MPNVEIHMPFEDGLAPSRKALKLEEKILKLTEKLICDGSIGEDDMVFSHHNTPCYDRHGTPQPFVRIFSTNPSDFTMITKAIARLKLDIECVVVERFFLKGKQE